MVDGQAAAFASLIRSGSRIFASMQAEGVRCRYVRIFPDEPGTLRIHSRRGAGHEYRHAGCDQSRLETQRWSCTTKPADLARAGPERSTVGDMVLRNAGRLTDMATLTHPAAQAARNFVLHFVLGLHAVQDKMAATMSEIERIGYPGQPAFQRSACRRSVGAEAVRWTAAGERWRATLRALYA